MRRIPDLTNEVRMVGYLDVVGHCSDCYAMRLDLSGEQPVSPNPFSIQ